MAFLRISVFGIFVAVSMLAVMGCSSGTSSNNSSSSSRALNSYETDNGTTANTGFKTSTGTCAQLTMDTSSCSSTRQALGFSGNWLDFSCNIVEGLATSSQGTATTFSSAYYVTLTTPGLPNYDSNYYPTSGSYSFTAYGYTVTGLFDSLYTAFSPYFPDPNSIGQKSETLYIPIAPQAASSESQTMSGGVVGMAINGVLIFDSMAGNTDNIFAESGSFDECGGHPDNSSSYHYHGEPYAISYNDDHLIGVMRDGFFIYGRQDSDGATPGTIALEEAGGNNSGNFIYVYGGHTGSAPSASDANPFHYHLTEWEGCFDETLQAGQGYVKSADDGETDDPTKTFNTASAGSCAGTWVDTWFLTGHGTGGVFDAIPSGLTGQNPSQTATAVRYYYGTAGPCSPSCTTL